MGRKNLWVLGTELFDEDGAIIEEIWIPKPTNCNIGGIILGGEEPVSPRVRYFDDLCGWARRFHRSEERAPFLLGCMFYFDNEGTLGGQRGDDTRRFVPAGLG